MSIQHKWIVTAMVVLIGLAGCGKIQPAADSSVVPEATPATAISTPIATINVPTNTPIDGDGDVNRVLLTFDNLMKGFDFASPVDEAALTIPEEAGSPTHTFEGRLELKGEATNGQFQVLRGALESEEGHLPEFEFEFVQSGSHLIPVQRGSIITTHPVWNYIIGPGRVWQEHGDQGYSRASFPFALVVKGGNATFNDFSSGREVKD